VMICFVVFAVVVLAQPWPASKDIPRVVINLDAEPETRY